MQNNVAYICAGGDNSSAEVTAVEVAIAHKYTFRFKKTKHTQSSVC